MMCCNMRKLSGSKKGSITDAITVMVVLFVIGLTTVLMWFVFDTFRDALAGTPIYTEDMERAANSFDNVLRLFDYVLVIILLVIIAAQAFLNYKVAAEPSGFAAVFLLAAAVGLVGLFFSFVYASITREAVLVTAAGMFPSTLVILTNLHWVGLLSLLIGSITLYAKRRQGQFE